MKLTNRDKCFLKPHHTLHKLAQIIQKPSTPWLAHSPITNIVNILHFGIGRQIIQILNHAIPPLLGLILLPNREIPGPAPGERAPTQRPQIIRALQSVQQPFPQHPPPHAEPGHAHIHQLRVHEHAHFELARILRFLEHIFQKIGFGRLWTKKENDGILRGVRHLPTAEGREFYAGRDQGIAPSDSPIAVGEGGVPLVGEINPDFLALPFPARTSRHDHLPQLLHAFRILINFPLFRRRSLHQRRQLRPSLRRSHHLLLAFRHQFRNERITQPAGELLHEFRRGFQGCEGFVAHARIEIDTDPGVGISAEGTEFRCGECRLFCRVIEGIGEFGGLPESEGYGILTCGGESAVGF
mmetsp:Transcript_20383/g.25001  ORF Transcript_20383/g.25001 Transcript_20383/m.25001 type:complete len:354 (+) Transcript_20383:162-1223(+)